MIKVLIQFILSLSLVLLLSCEKEKNSQTQLIGTWEIQSPDKDTLIFHNDSLLTRNNGAIMHFFKYGSTNNRLTIQYKGPNRILVPTTTHVYEINNEELFIDFSNGCYGFSSETYRLIKLD